MDDETPVDHSGELADWYAEDDEPEPSGAEIGLDLLAGIRVELGNLNEQYGQQSKILRELLEQGKREYPIHYPSVSSGVAVAGLNLSICVGGPSLGRRWNVRQANCGGIDPTVQVAGTGYWFKSAADPNAFDTESPILPLTILKDIAAPVGSGLTLPQVAFYGPRDFEVEPNDKVYCIIVGGTAGLTYTAAIEVDDLPAFPNLNVTST